jgi:hypothetical protein
MSFTVDEVIAQLDYEQPDDLAIAGEEVPTSRRQAWTEAQERLGVDAAFFQGAAPLVYFQGLSVPTESEVDAAVRDFHRRAWNHNRAPFLVVVLPDEIRVLDCLSAPFDDHELGRADAGATIRHALAEFRRVSVVSGGLVPRLQTLPRRAVVEVLRSDLAATRSSLIAGGLTAAVANDLIGRCLFVKYLEDRGALPSSDAATNFVVAVEHSVDATYGLFSQVYDRFNGDVFPVTSVERENVTSEHLRVVSDFLQGSRNGQQTFWPYYDFSVIPAELLSNVYEEFLVDYQRDSASFYTPSYLVDLVLDELLSSDDLTDAVLDPACGSGMFLARAYRRLIDLESTRQGRTLSPTELSDLLARSIFGCDIVPSAVRVAALSCYLVLLDHCTDEDIAAGVRFPVLLDKNLFEGDFFALMDRFDNQVFGLVVSNPPWRSHLTEPATDFVRRKHLPIGDNQIAQAFFWACEQIVSDDGRVGLLMPSKSSLYGRSGPNVAFRTAALCETNLDLVIDFSAFRHSVFRDAVGPMAVFILRPKSAARRRHVTFCTPRRSPLSESAGRVIVSGDEIKRIPRAEAIRRPDYWKAALSGTMRDVVLIETLRLRYPTLRELEDERGWILGSGFQTGGGEKHTSHLLQTSRFVPARNIQAFSVTSPSSERVQAEHFHRIRAEALFRGPHVLIRRGIDPDGHIRAAFLGEDAVFKNSVVGVAAPAVDTEALEILTGILNSDLARYYLYLTSTSWGIERPALEPTDLRVLPIALPDRNSELWSRLVRLVRGAANTEQPMMAEINEAIFDAYGLTATERSLVEDLVRVVISQHHRRLGSEAFDHPSSGTLETYRGVLQERLSQALGVTASAALDVTGSHYAAVSVGFGEEPRLSVLATLGGVVDNGPADQSGAVVLRRTVRFYRQRGVDIAKPTELRFWTRAAAIQDVDDIVAECLRSAEKQDAVVA